MEFVLTSDMTALEGVSTNVEYTVGENMKRAGLNTLIGMGTVFVVLILISLIISVFSVIPKIEANLKASRFRQPGRFRQRRLSYRWKKS